MADKLSTSLSPSGQILKGKFLRRFKPNIKDPTLIPAEAFRPSQSDVDGLSVSQFGRPDLPNPIARVLANTRNPPETYSVCLFETSDQDAFTVIASPTQDDQGHAHIPELPASYCLLKSNDEKRPFKMIMDDLRRRSTIIHNAGDVIPPLIPPDDLKKPDIKASLLPPTDDTNADTNH